MVKTVRAAQDVAIIDFEPALHGGPDDLEQVAAAVVSACEDIGFLYVANHPIPATLRQRVFEETANFFALPEEQKMRVAMERSLNYRGYIPLDAPPKAENRRGAGVDGFQIHLDDEVGPDDQPAQLAPDASESLQIHRSYRWTTRMYKPESRCTGLISGLPDCRSCAAQCLSILTP